jgi:hypothetical protein
MLLRPILIPPTDMVLCLLKEDELVSHALFDKHSTGVLCYNRLLVLDVC